VAAFFTDSRAPAVRYRVTFAVLVSTVDGVAGLGEEDRMNGIIPKTASSNEVAAGERPRLAQCAIARFHVHFLVAC
jgi:hypothetical protein